MKIQHKFDNYSNLCDNNELSSQVHPASNSFPAPQMYLKYPVAHGSGIG